MTLAAALDYVALLGIWLALVISFNLAVRGPFGVIQLPLLIFAAAVVWLGKADIWAGAYEFGRTMSPMLLLLGLLWASSKKYLYIIPLACVLPRMALQLQPQLFGVLAGLWKLVRL